MSDIICPTCGTNGLDCLRKDCQMVADQLAPWTGREVFASMADAVNPPQSRFRCDVHGSYTEAGCATCRAQALQTTQLGVTPINPLQAQLDAAKARIVGLEKDFKRSEREWETMRAALAAAEARMASAPEPMPADFFPETHEEGDAISGTCVMVGRAPDGFKIKLGFVHTGKSPQDWRLMKALRESVWVCLEWHRLGRDDMLSLMAIDDAPKPLDPGAGAVAGRVDGVIEDALAGRLTKSQKSGVRSAIDRSDRVSPSSDQAVGKAIGG